tara:strand:+ start:1415 stop:1570 length:156 start_codon:yes stop_codon:yes gene_type:complete
MAWICTNARENDPHREVMAKGQGRTPEEAADAALEAFGSNVADEPRAPHTK